MILVDTSVWIEVFRDASESIGKNLRHRLAGDLPVLSRFTQLELLQGAADEGEWEQLSSYLDTQIYLELSERAWTRSARIYFELRRHGKTVRSPIDCCIAQLAIENSVLLLHRDQDFIRIASFFPLKEEYWGQKTGG